VNVKLRELERDRKMVMQAKVNLLEQKARLESDLRSVYRSINEIKEYLQKQILAP
jgi:hypothetical protein